MSEYKKCSACQNWYPVSYFSKSKSRKDNLHPECKTCVSLRQKDHYCKFGDIFGRQRLSTLKKRAKKYGDDDISEQNLKELWKRQDGKCYYTAMNLVKEPHHWNTASVDRKNSNLGYTKENMVLCCDRINLMKGELSIPLFLKFCKLVASNKELKSQSQLIDESELDGAFLHNKNRLSKQFNSDFQTTNGQSSISL